MEQIPAVLAALSLTSLQAAEYFVSPAGNDAAAGTKTQPFATLERARDAVRETGVAE